MKTVPLRQYLRGLKVAIYSAAVIVVFGAAIGGCVGLMVRAYRLAAG